MRVLVGVRAQFKNASMASLLARILEGKNVRLFIGCLFFLYLFVGVVEIEEYPFKF